ISPRSLVCSVKTSELPHARSSTLAPTPALTFACFPEYSAGKLKAAITISLVKEAKGGPFVFWDDLAAGCEKAATLGFDAVEIFAPSANVIDPKRLNPLLDRHGLKVAAVGTGAGWIIHKWHLCHANPDIRRPAR